MSQSDATNITNVMLRAAEKLRVKNKALARILGVSESTVSRIRAGDHPLEPTQKAFEFAVLLVRLYRSLNVMVGGDDTVAAAWLANDNTALAGKPLDLIQAVAGLGHVIHYLDARRAA